MSDHITERHARQVKARLERTEMKTAKAQRTGLVGEGEFIPNPDNREPAKRAAREAAAIERNRLELDNIECHKAHLARQYSLERSAKFDAAYSIAWDQGHSSGFNEVTNYFIDLLPLLEQTDLATLKAERDFSRDAWLAVKAERDELREALGRTVEMLKMVSAMEEPDFSSQRPIRVFELELKLIRAALDQARAILARTEPK